MRKLVTLIFLAVLTSLAFEVHAGTVDTPVTVAEGGVREDQGPGDWGGGS